MNATCADFGYDADDQWAKLPLGRSWREVVGMATDSRNRVFVFSRGPNPLMILDRDGAFVAAWDHVPFVRPHGITIGPDDSVYLTDETDHTVKKFSPDGRLLFTLGTSRSPSNTGAAGLDYRTITKAAGPFHYPTNVALSPNGDIYVSDGYGNSRVHRFDGSGKLLHSWGTPGAGPGQFHLPHGIAVANNGIVFVADRENSRIQLFTSEGEFLDQWTDLARPCQVYIQNSDRVFVAELGYRAGMWPGTSAPLGATGGRLSVFDMQGKLLARWGGGENPCAAGDFFAPHDICVDVYGDIYVAEVVMSGGGDRGLVSPDCHTIQKFVRRRR